MIGRYFMEHPLHAIGDYVTDTTKTNFGMERQIFGPTREMIQSEGIGNCGIRFDPLGDRHLKGGLAAARRKLKALACANHVVADFLQTIEQFYCIFNPPFPADAGALVTASEQLPNWNSRVALSDEVDEFGLQKLKLDWQLLPADKETMRRMGLSVGEYFLKADLGRVKLVDWVLSEDGDVPGLDDGERIGGHHHMGTTRMGSSSEDGVVDRNSRLFEVPNLYVAGSSVFRTAGDANPTLTIV